MNPYIDVEKVAALATAEKKSEIFVTASPLNSVESPDGQLGHVSRVVTSATTITNDAYKQFESKMLGNDGSPSVGVVGHMNLSSVPASLMAHDKPPRSPDAFQDVTHSRSASIRSSEIRGDDANRGGSRRLHRNASSPSEKPWILFPDQTTAPESGSASHKASAEHGNFEMPWVLAADPRASGGRPTSTVFVHKASDIDRDVHPPAAVPNIIAAGTEEAEDLWVLNHDNSESESRPVSVTGGTGPKSGSLQRRPADGANKGQFHLDDPSSFGPFAISLHKNNLIIEVREGETMLSRLGLGSKKESSDESEFYTRPEPRSYRINFAELQRVHLRKLQCKLVKHVVDMRFRNIEPPGWEADLQAYTRALQDYDYMVKCSRSSRDSFLVTGERIIDDYVMRNILDTCPVPRPKYEHLERAERVSVSNGDGLKASVEVTGPWEDEWLPIGGTRSGNTATSRALELRNNTVMAILGGLFLVGPMWLMVLHKTLYTGLVATTVCVVLFGVVMALLLEKPMDVLSGTAAYAAVLVVFVGLSNT